MWRGLEVLVVVVVGVGSTVARAEPTPCESASTLAALAWIEAGKRDPQIDGLLAVACAKANAQASMINYVDGSPALENGAWKYPDGSWACIGPEYQDAGTWKYPDGSWAFVGPAYKDAGSWKYPSGSWAFIGPAYEDAGSWKYPDGTWAFVGPAYKEAGSWKYPDGSWAFVGPAYEDAGSWKYPDGTWAFYGPAYRETGVWHYPDGVAARDGKTRSALADVSLLADLVAAKMKVKKLKTSAIPGWRRVSKDLRTLILLRWIRKIL